MASAESNVPVAAQAAPPASKDMMEVFQQRVTGKLQGDEKTLKALDPVMWAGIFSTVIQLLGDCKKNRSKEQIRAAMKNPNVVQRMSLRRGLIKELGRAKVRNAEVPLVDAVINVAKEAKDGEIVEFHEQILQG
jgi:hypothetical protein